MIDNFEIIRNFNTVIAWLNLPYPLLHCQSVYLKLSTIMDDKRLEKHKKISEAGFELKKALEAWDELSQHSSAISADDQLLEDVQSLLKKLKSQIDQFESN